MELCINPHNNLGKYRAKRINQYIADTRFPKRYKGLVPFVETGIGYGDQKRDDRPIESPSETFCANSMKNSDAKDAELGDMCHLSNSKMHHFQRVRARGREKPSQDGKDEPSGLLGAEVMSGKQRNQNRDDNRWDPVSEARMHLGVFDFEVGAQGYRVGENQR